MSTSSPLTFHCPKLQKAFAQAKPILDDYEKSFDQTSEDIKNLELYLSERNIRCRISRQVYFEVDAGGGSRYPMEIFTDKQRVDIREDFIGTPGTIYTYSILWDEVEWPAGKKRFRLQYEQTEIKGDLKMDELGIPFVVQPKSRSTSRLALIEAPLEMRLLLRDHLPSFVNYLSVKLQSQPDWAELPARA